jgi:hypothetical protein
MSTIQNRTSREIQQILIHAMMLRAGLHVPAPMAERADPFKNLSLCEMCRDALLAQGVQPAEDWESMVRTAITTGPVQDIFTTAINAALFQSFDKTEDPSVGWCLETTVKNFLPQKRATLHGTDQLEPIPRGGTAGNAKLDLSNVETYRVGRFGKQFVVDEQDVIDDNVAAITAVPAALGAAAKQLRPDLVFSILAENAALADGLALFHTDRGNTFSLALDATNLAAVATAMASQYRTGEQESKICLNIRGKYLIVAEALRFPAAAIVRALETANGNTSLTLRSDGRIDLGVRNPETGSNYTGSATAWYLASPDRPAIEVGYLQPDRRPVIRQFKLDAGQYGIGYDIKFDIGAKSIYTPGIFRGRA